MKKLSALLLLLSVFAFVSCDNTELDPPADESTNTEYQQDENVDDIDPRSLEERNVR